MKISLNAVLALSGLAYLTGIARLILEVRFVPEIMNAMPADQPGQVALVMLVPLVFFGGWLWALLALVGKWRGGLSAAMMFSLILAMAWGLPTIISFCPTPCATVAPLTDIVTWANVIVGVIASLVIGFYMRALRIAR